MSAMCHFNKFAQNGEVKGGGWGVVVGGVTLQITHLKCDGEGAGGNHCFSLKVQFFEIFVVITGGNNLFYWWTRGRKCTSRQVLISRLCPVLGKDRILCHCSPGHQLFNFIISTYDRYFFPPLETWELIGEPTIFASGHLEMEQKILRRFKEHIWKAARWHYPNLLMDSWSNPTPRVFWGY